MLPISERLRRFEGTYMYITVSVVYISIDLFPYHPIPFSIPLSRIVLHVSYLSLSLSLIKICLSLSYTCLNIFHQC